jgi:AcrR family transcriptional regulator
MPEPERRAAPIGPRQALQQRVESAILDAAARTYASEDEEANLADVAVAAGVARATVYRYFPSRRRLLAALARRTAEETHDRLVAARIQEVDAEEGVSRAVRAFVEIGDAFVVLVRERGRAEEAEFDRLVAEPVRRLLERGRAQGRVRDDIPVAWLAESLVGLVVGVAQDGTLGPDDAVAAITSVFLEGARAVAGGAR